MGAGTRRLVCLVGILLLACLLPAASAGEGDTKRYVVHWFNGDSAEVYFDGVFGGTIVDTELFVAVDQAAPPAWEYAVWKGDHLMYTGFIGQAPDRRGED